LLLSALNGAKSAAQSAKSRRNLNWSARGWSHAVVEREQTALFDYGRLFSIFSICTDCSAWDGLPILWHFIPILWVIGRLT